MPLQPANPADCRFHILQAKKLKGRYRVVLRGTRRIALRPWGAPVDKGGYDNPDVARKQAYAITKQNEEAHRIQPACR